MKIRLPFFAFFSVALIISMPIAAFAEVPRDAELEKLIVGKWQSTTYHPETQIEVNGSTEYRADGTFSGSGTLSMQGQVLSVGASGVWSVKGTVLTWTIRETLNPDIIAVGESGDDEILEINRYVMKYRGESGDIVEETRVTE